MAKKFTGLTKPIMRRLSAGEAICEHGIEFRRDTGGDGTFSVNIMVDRRRFHRVVGRESEGVTRQHAEDFIARARTDARRDRLDLPHARKTSLGFRQAASEYVVRLRAEDGRNTTAKERQLRQHLTPFFRDSPLSKITSFDIERYKRHRTKRRAAPATINRELAVVSHLLNKAIEWGWIVNTVAKIARFKECNGRITYLTKQQCAQLLAASARDQNENVHAFVMVALHTGMRHSEILAIQREEIDLAKQIIWIPKAKAGAREQPITTELAEYLAQRIKMLPPGCAWIFPSPASRSGHTHTIRKAFIRSVIRASLDPDHVTPHVLRHTAVTHLVQAGVDLPTVQRISGHKTLAMVARYAHQNGAHIQKAMQALNDIVGDEETTEDLQTADKRA